ncbi:MAG: hypothetical protein H6727_09250 [Myxococcales bacterium]|nr:hypothetical protein [Myxococcales bacterium]
MVLPSNGAHGTNPLNLNSILQTIEVSGDDKSPKHFKLKPISKLKLPKMQAPHVEIPLPSESSQPKLRLLGPVSPTSPRTTAPTPSLPRKSAPAAKQDAQTAPRPTQATSRPKTR